MLTEVLKIHPDANTTVKSVMWYRNRLRKNGEKVPTSTEAKTNVSTRKPIPTSRGAHLNVVRASLRDWQTNQQALEAAMSEFPNSRVNLRDISSVRNSLRRNDEKVPTDNEARRRQERRSIAADLKPTQSDG